MSDNEIRWDDDWNEESNDPFMYPDGDDTDIEEIARNSQMGEAVKEADFDTILLNDVRVPAASAQVTDLGRFEGKQTTGPYTKDSDNTQSTWAQDNWGGGQLINKHISGGTDQRFRSAKAWTLNAQQLTLPPLLERSPPWGIVYNGADTDTDPPPNVFHASCPIGEFNDAFWYAIGSQLFKLTTIPNTFDEVDIQPVASLMYPPVNIGAIYGPGMDNHTLEERRPRLWVPLGERGIQNIRDTDNVSPLEPDIKAVAVRAFGRSLYALTVDGYLRQYVQWDGNYQGEWLPATSDMKIDRDQRPMDLEVFYDRAGNQALFVQTDKQMWAYDDNTFTLIPTGLRKPKHPDNGWGFTAWRDDAIYTTSGIGGDRYSRDGVRTPWGLDRDDSVDITELLDPYPTTGATGGSFFSQWVPRKNDNQDPDGIAKGMVPPTVPFIGSMTGSLNYLLMGMGRGFSSEVIDGVTVNTSRMSIEAWNEAGYHTIADFEVRTQGCFITPGPLVMSETVGGYRVWMGMLAWGTDMITHAGPETLVGSALEDYSGQIGLVSMQLPRHNHGPKQLITKNVGRFESHGYLKTGWFTNGMEGFDKLNSHFEVYLAMPEGMPDDEPFPENAWVDTYYRTDNDRNTWHFLMRSQKYGRNVMPFGIEPDGFPAGEDAMMIEFKHELYSGDVTFTPVIETTVLKFIPIPLHGRAWLIQIPLDTINANGFGPREADNHLSRLTTDPKFTRMIHDDNHHRVRIAQHQMQEGTGKAPFKIATINAVEVAIPGYDWPAKPPDVVIDDGE